MLPSVIGELNDLSFRSAGRDGSFMLSLSVNLGLFGCLKERKSLSSGLTGAKPTPQLPITTVVTPCQLDGAKTGSQVAWPS